LRYLTRMSDTAVDVVVCPPELRADAIALALCELAPSQRREIGRDVLLPLDGTRSNAADGLFVALRGAQLRGATWGQFQPGNTAVFWPPRLDAGENESPTSARLTEAALSVLDKAGVAMTQVLLPAQDAPEAQLLKKFGFRYLTDLVYLTCEKGKFASESPTADDLHFEPYTESQCARLMQLTEATYEGTLDCPGLDGERRIIDVIDGYQATGTFRPSNWLFVRGRLANQSEVVDIGVLLLAEHVESRHIELIYMGLIPAARGRGWGRQIVQHAIKMASCVGSDRVVCAVDAENLPGLAVYRDTFFETWDRRSIFLRFLNASH